MPRLLIIAIFVLAGCTQESEPAGDHGLPTQNPVSAVDVLAYISKAAARELPEAEVLEQRLDTAPSMEQLMLGLSLAASSDRGAEAPPFLVNALADEAIAWTDDGRQLVELLLRRTRAEHHFRAAKQAADASLATERVRRQELETTLEALRQIDREMSDDERP